MSKKQEFAYKLITVEGMLGSGKTTTAVALCVDAYKEDNTTKVFAMNVNIKLPTFQRVSMEEIAEWINTEKLTNAYILIDEAYIGADARNSMSNFNKLFTWFIQQSRKRKLQMIMVTQNARFLDWRIRQATTTRYLCRYKPRTEEILLHLRQVGARAKIIKYYAPQYWKYFDTFEVPEVPEVVIAKTLASLGLSPKEED